MLQLHTWAKLSGCQKRLPCGVSSFPDPDSLELARLEAHFCPETFPGDHNWAVKAVVSSWFFSGAHTLLRQRGSRIMVLRVAHPYSLYSIKNNQETVELL